MCVKFLCKVPSDSKKQNQFPEFSFQRPPQKWSINAVLFPLGPSGRA